MIRTLSFASLLSAASLLGSPATGQGLNFAAANRLQGPIETPGMHVTVGEGRVEAKGYRYLNNGIKHDAFGAKWIWLPEADQSNPTLVRFRKTIELKSPNSAHFWISADVIYRLYINGRLVSRGPADMGRDYDREERAPRWMYDCRDLGPYLHSGKNEIAAEVFSRGFVGSRVSRGKHGLLLEAAIKTQNGEVRVKTDESWKVKPDAAWGADGQWSAEKEDIGWQLPGYSDAGWSSAGSVGTVWTPLVASELPPLMEAEYPFTTPAPAPTNPLTITADSAVTLKHSRVLSAYPGLVIQGIKGATLRIIPGEQEGNLSRTLTLHLRDGLQQFEYPFLDSYSVLRLEFTGVTAPIKVLKLHSVFSSAAVEYKGSFECSSPEWNRLWKTSRWLTQICMQTHHLDSPNHQEPICDPGDYLIESHANYYTFGSPWLARQDLRKFGLLLKDLNYRNFHTSYSLLWLQMLMAYYDHTGDSSLVKELAPEVHALLETFNSWVGTNGLISEAPNYMFMDWVRIAGFECHHPPAVIGQGYMTAFYYRALMDGRRVAEVTGDGLRVARYNNRRIEISTAFQRELWSERTGLYRDGRPFQTHVQPGTWLPADKDIETFSPHVNTMAVLYDLAPQDKQSAIMERIQKREQPLNCEPYFMYYVLEALAHSGRFEQDAPAVIARWNILPDTQTYHEMWVEGDLSHAWGSAPMIQMSSTVLGVRPVSPGWKSVKIAPQLGGLNWARGTVPTPHGFINISFKKNSGKLKYEITLPAGTNGELSLPGHSRVITLHAGHQAG